LYFKEDKMADVREFELFHGIVLTKLLRSEKPTTLRMVETNPQQAWAAYEINDEVTLYIKYRTGPHTLSRGEGGQSWAFVFSSSELEKIQALKSKKQVYLALVCGKKAITGGDCGMRTCLLDPDKLRRIIDVTATGRQTVTVKSMPGKSLRVSGSSTTKPLIVSRNELDTWIVPGS